MRETVIKRRGLKVSTEREREGERELVQRALVYMYVYTRPCPRLFEFFLATYNNARAGVSLRSADITCKYAHIIKCRAQRVSHLLVRRSSQHAEVSDLSRQRSAGGSTHTLKRARFEGEVMLAKQQPPSYSGSPVNGTVRNIDDRGSTTDEPTTFPQD